MMLRRPRLFWIGLSVLVLLTVADQVEWRMRQERQLRTAAASAVVVRAESGPGGAHTSVGVVEQTSDRTAFTFALLGTWNFGAPDQPACPDTIRHHDGTRQHLAGFMYPLGDGPRVTSFCLLRSTQTCCFGPRPQFNQYLLVECREPVELGLQRPIVVNGVFRVDPQPSQGFIYRLEDATVSEAGGDGMPRDPRAYAADHGLRFWDWSDLARVSGHLENLPDLQRHDGEQVVATGTVLLREPGPPALFMLGNDSLSSSIGMFGALTVVPRADAALPQPWDTTVTWQGRIRICPKDQWPDQGVARLEDARPCTAAGAALDAGPFLGWWNLGFFAIALLIVCVGRTRTDDTTDESPESRPHGSP